MVVRDQAQRAAPLAGPAIEDDRPRLRDREGGGGDHAVGGVQCARGQVVVGEQRDARRVQSGEFETGRHYDPARPAPGVTLLADDGLSPGALDAVDGVLTTAALAIAETGTIILDGGPGQGRRALSLVPDYHLCLLQAGQIVGIVPEALDRLPPGRPYTWISGPSATSDIELDRVQGVHGPRTLEVILIAP